LAGIASSEDEAIDMMAHASLALVDVAPGDVQHIASSALLGERSCAVLFMISEDDEAALLAADMRRPNGYIVKPFTDRELRVHIELALSRLDAARAVHELEDRFFATSIDMLCFLNFSGHFKRLNPAWERTLGFTREELMSKPFIEFVHPDDRERTLNQNREVRGGGKALGFENRYLCKDGSYRWFLWNAAPDTAEQVIYSVARDVTASKHAAHEREQLVRELQAALDEVKALRGILPMCSYCRKVRDDNDYWHTVENYISTHTTTMFTHGICPSCVATEIEPQLAS
jgi:PAS domain S-box-containing protein